MIIVNTLQQLHKHLNEVRNNDKLIGFVPTMGALHAGHITLINAAKYENNLAVCSIFVNPTQFNSDKDLEKYPKTIEADIQKLEAAHCDILFVPSVNEMYPANEKLEHYNLGYLENILEGKYRPGHFQGVCIIVDKLLAAVMPNKMYVGRKDYQQCMVIQKMMQQKLYNTTLVICDTVREKDGLAMSSRNKRLTETERTQALHIINALQTLVQNFKKGDVSMLKNQARLYLENNGFKVDYVEIADAKTLEIIDTWDAQKKVVALTAAYINEVRLIDNIDL